MSKRALSLAILCMGITSVLALVMGVDELAHVPGGSSERVRLLAISTLCSVLVSVGTVVYASRQHFRSRRRLHWREQQVAADAATTCEWLWETDNVGRFTYSNAAVEQMLGYAPEALIGTNTLHLLVNEADRAFVRRVLDEPTTALTGGNVRAMTWRHRDGHGVVLQGSTVALFDERAQAIGIRGSRRPLSGEATLAREAASARRRVATLLASPSLDVALQPIISLSTGRIVGAEALARFPDGRSPELWFADARRGGLSKELERHAFAAALELFGVLPESAYLSVNASPDVLMDASWIQELLTLEVPLERLVVEITEHTHIDEYDALITSLRPLRHRGVRLAVDDTGAGYASLNHVLQLRPDIIKLDRTLIAGLTEDRARRSLVTALVLLGLDIGATLTGEGAETVEQLDALNTLGVENAQGYAIAKPSTDVDVWAVWPDRTWCTTCPPRSITSGVEVLQDAAPNSHRGSRPGGSVRHGR
jgi:PAS domain S-box-containing protein